MRIHDRVKPPRPENLGAEYCMECISGTELWADESMFVRLRELAPAAKSEALHAVMSFLLKRLLVQVNRQNCEEMSRRIQRRIAECP